MTISYVAQFGTNTSKTTGTTLTVSGTPGTQPAAGDLVVVACARDDIASDWSGQDTCTDGHGNIYAPTMFGSTHTNTSAADGTVAVLFTSVLQTAWSGSTTITWTHPSVTARAMQVHHWTTGGNLYRVGNPYHNSGTSGSTNIAQPATVSGDLIVAITAGEADLTAITVTGDSDTTDGSWSTITTAGTTGSTSNTNQFTGLQYKVTTGSSAQTYNVSWTPNAADIACVSAVFREGTPADITFAGTLGSNTATSAATTTTTSSTDTPAVGDLVVVWGARDDASSDALNDSMSDGHGNTFTQQLYNSSNATDVTAADGCVIVGFYSVLTTAWSGTTTCTWTHPSVAVRAMQVGWWRPAAGYTISYQGTLGTGRSTAGIPSATSSSLAAGDLCVGVLGVELDFSASYPTRDTDTSNGAWAPPLGPVGTTGGTSNTNQFCYMQYKLALGSGTQTFNPVTASGDSVVMVFAFRQADITVNGTASSDFTFTATATGTRTVTGTAAGTFTFAGPAVGTRTVNGAAASAFTFTATADGTVGQFGTAASDFTFTATAVGTRTVPGVAAADFTFTGQAVGTRTAFGVAASAFTFTATADGTVTSGAATASSDFAFTATAVGYVPATVTVINAGTFPLSWRWTLTLTPTAGTVRVYNLADVGEPGLTLGPISGVAVLVLDAHTRTVSADSVDAYDLVQPGSGWPALLPGDNTLTVEGATGTLDYTPIYT